jgi:iron(III) transport system substrate-binding protein
MTRTLLSTGAALAMGLGLSLGLGGAALAQQKTKVTLYTSLESEQLAIYKKAIEADVPDVDIQWVRDATGVITARIMAEKDNPRADMIFALAATSLLLFEKEGLLEAYTPKGSEALKPAFKDQKPPITWMGMDAFLGVICHNTVEGQKAGIAIPTTWKDLTQPALKGKVVMPHPVSSGTGYLMVAAWLQMMGESAGWAYMDALHENIAVYTHSGSAPCVQAARGERIAGIGFDMRGAREKTQGAPIEVVVPAEGTGWDMEASAIIKGTKNLEAVKKIADWAVGKNANSIYATYYALVALPGVGTLPTNYPKEGEARMAKNDFDWMAQNRERILAEWTKRYEGKAAPKN